MKQPQSRRAFLRTSAAALVAAPFIIRPFATSAAPASLTGVVSAPGKLRLRWNGGQPPWVVEETAVLGPAADWQPVATLLNQNHLEVNTDQPARHFRVRSHAGPYQDGLPPNWDFQTGDFTGWTATPDDGTAEVRPDIDQPGNYAARLTTGATGGPVRIAAPITTPADFFYLIFDTRFLAAGTLEVSVFDPAANNNLGVETPVGQVIATAADPGLNTHTLVVDKNAVKHIPGAQIRFTLEGPVGSAVMLDNITLVPGAAALECTYVGDPIGNNAASTTGTGGHASQQGAQEALPNDPRNWDRILGATGFLYEADGKSLLKNFRTVVAIIKNGSGNPEWNAFSWSISIFTESAFLNKGVPVKDVYLGLPDNWEGYVIEPNVGVFPVHPFWSYPFTSQPTTKAWELKWDLSQHSPLREALPTGRYIFVFRGVANISYGLGYMPRTFSGVGPEPYFANTVPDAPGFYEPAKAIPGLRPETNFRWAMHLTEEKLVGN